MSSCHYWSSNGPSSLPSGKSHTGASDLQTLNWTMVAKASGNVVFSPSAAIEERTKKNMKIVSRWP